MFEGVAVGRAVALDSLKHQSPTIIVSFPLDCTGEVIFFSFLKLRVFQLLFLFRSRSFNQFGTGNATLPAGTHFLQGAKALAHHFSLDWGKVN